MRYAIGSAQPVPLQADGRELNMKKTLTVLLITLASLFAVETAALAQDAGPTPQAAPGQPMWRMRTHGMKMGGPGMFRGRMMRFHRRETGGWWRNPEIAQRIGLSSQQKEQLEKISQDGRLKMIDLRADLEKQQVILGPMMRTFHPDEAQVLAQVEKLSEARAALEKERVQTLLDSRNVLTEDQWNKLKDMRRGFHHGFGRRNFRRPMRPQTPAATPST
jgi:Spy/CpxP family protein refolding chaperone